MSEPQDVFAMLAQRLREAVHTLEADKGDGEGPPLPGSPAAIENQDTSLHGVWSQAPARDANILARLLCVSASDHLLAMADTVESKTTGVFASYTAGRGVLEAAGRAWYLTDPAADVRERVRRAMNERLWDINESRRFLKVLEADTTDLDALEQEICQTAPTKNFTVIKARSGYQLDTERPSATKLCGLILASPSGGTNFGEATYRFLSSPAHGGASGLVGHLVNFDGTIVTPGKDSETMARYLLWPVKAYLQMGDRFLRHYGWDSAHWGPARNDALAFWRDHAAQGLAGAPSPST